MIFLKNGVLMDYLTWFNGLAGQWAIKAEKSFLDQSIRDCRRNDVLQLGAVPSLQWISREQVTRFYLLDPLFLDETIKTNIQSPFDLLPIQSESMDLVFCAHALERVTDTAALLEESYRVLKPEGKMIVVGLHRWSIWRLCNLFRCQKIMPTVAFHSIDKIVLQLQRLGLLVELQKTACFQLPTHKKQSAVLETLGQFLLPSLGAVYMIVASKKEVGVTPLFDRLLARKTSVLVEESVS
jgi:SAM-dependent methyltransferase